MNPAKAYTLALVAARAAKSATKIKGAKIGAVALFRNSQYKGWNSRTTHPRQAEDNPNPHAIALHGEIACMIRSGWRGTHLVVVRILHDGGWGMAKPCVVCQRALVSCKEVWFSTGVGFELERMRCQQ